MHSVDSAPPIIQVNAPFSAAELQAMCQDGLLAHVYGGSYVRAGHPVDSVVRAQAAASLIPEGARGKVAFGRRTAAWIYGCALPPARLSLLADHRRRTTALRSVTDAVMHEVALGPMDVASVGGVPVTTPLRTALDVALHIAGREGAGILRRMSAEPSLGCSLDLVSAALEAGQRVPGKQRALELLALARQSPEIPDASVPVSSAAAIR